MAPYVLTFLTKKGEKKEFTIVFSCLCTVIVGSFSRSLPATFGVLLNKCV